MLLCAPFAVAGRDDAPPLSRADRAGLKWPHRLPSSVENLIVPDDYASIQSAITAAGPGDTVWVRAGIYDETLTFKEGIRLVGEGSDKVTVRYDGHKGAALVANECTTGWVAGMTFEHTGHDTDENRKPVVWVADSRVVLYRCRVCSGLGVGLGVVGGEPLIQDCVIERNAWEGLFVSQPGTKAHLRGNECRRNGSDGILVCYQAIAFVEDNRCEGNGRSGIAVRDAGTGADIDRNICRANGHGVFFGKGASGSATENLCAQNVQGGIAVFNIGTAPRLERNECVENRHGIYFGEGAAGTAESNTCVNNRQGGIAVHDLETKPTLRGNECRRNAAGIYYQDGASGLAERNACLANTESGIQVFFASTAPVLRKNTCSFNGSYGIYIHKDASPELSGNRGKNNTKGLLHDGRSKRVAESTPTRSKE
jgi:parallel beta-helix repeat protein